MSIKSSGFESKETNGVEESNDMAMGNRCSLLLTLYLFPLTVIVGASATGYGYGPNPNSYDSKNKFFPEVFSVQGVVYCKSASGVIPHKGQHFMSFFYFH